MKTVSVVGAGLAGCEAAWQLAERGIKVILHEMRPEVSTAAHKTDKFAELVCSNSLGALNYESAAGLLKRELEILNSLLIKTAREVQVPAGGALAVDRQRFAALVTEKVVAHPNITLISGEVTDIPPSPVIIATGPLTEGKLAEAIANLLGEEMLSFFDAAAPIIYTESIDMSRTFWGSRYQRGDDDYLNCPMTETEYRVFYSNLVHAKTVCLKDFENKFFEQCLPIEEMARRGYQTLVFGPLKPVGLGEPNTQRPYAVAQLRHEDNQGQLMNLVGFQTNLLWPEQKRVFRLIPGLEQAEFARFGVMHRNSYINAPKVFSKNFRLSGDREIYIAGQLAGVEGYVESMMSGLVAALDLWSRMNEREFLLPPETMSGSLSNFVTKKSKNFQPMNANFGLLPPLTNPLRDKRMRRSMQVQRAAEKIVLLAKDLNN